MLESFCPSGQEAAIWQLPATIFSPVAHRVWQTGPGNRAMTRNSAGPGPGSEAAISGETRSGRAVAKAVRARMLPAPQTPSTGPGLQPALVSATCSATKSALPDNSGSGSGSGAGKAVNKSGGATAKAALTASPAGKSAPADCSSTSATASAGG